MQKALTLLEANNPYGNICATVEDDGRTVYLYLSPYGTSEQDARAVWVANRIPAPTQDDRGSADVGIPPLMPRRGTRHPDGHPGFSASDLSLLWFPEGDGVTLLYHGLPVAMLPPWYGSRGCTGYSLEAIGEERLAWEMDAGVLQTLSTRLEQSRDFWLWRAEPASWPAFQMRSLAHLESRLGPHHRYIAGNQFDTPRIDVAQFQPHNHRGASVYTTVGMSAQPLPQVDLYFDDATTHRRVELAIAMTTEHESVASLLAGLGRYPWDSYTWLGNGHTIAMATPWLFVEAGLSPVVLLLTDPPAKMLGSPMNPRFSCVPDLTGLRDRSGEPVTYLWVLPINIHERDLARGRGPSELIQKIAREGRGWLWTADMPGPQAMMGL